MNTTQTPMAVPLNTAILTSEGWLPVRQAAAGMPLAHPVSKPSRLLRVTDVGMQPMLTLMMADRTSITVSTEQRLDVVVGIGQVAKPQQIRAAEVQAALVRGDMVRMPRHDPYDFGMTQALPIAAWTLGALLGDGYLRRHGVEWCSENARMYELMAAALPHDVMLTPMRVGQAGTGSASIIARHGRRNSVLEALRALELAGSRAWEKRIPSVYMTAPLQDRLDLLTGCLDTDGSVDSFGRVEFSSSSQEFAENVLTLIQDLGGRARLSRKTGITFTSPRQRTPKAARDSFRVGNIRLPESVTPFRREDKASRMVRGRVARQWKVVSAESAPAARACEVTVTAIDGRWLGGLGTPLGSPTSMCGQIAEVCP